jgi:hypothetical protein
VDLRIQAASILVGLLIWAMVTIAVKRARLYPSFAALWFGIGALLVLLPAYAELLRWVASEVFGIIGANHFIYVMLFAFLLVYLFYLTQKVCQLTNRVERVIVSLAILEASGRLAQAPGHTAATTQGGGPQPQFPWPAEPSGSAGSR